MGGGGLYLSDLMLLSSQDRRIQGRDPTTLHPSAGGGRRGALQRHQRDTCRLLVSPCVSCASGQTRVPRQRRPYRLPMWINAEERRDQLDQDHRLPSHGGRPPTGDQSIKGIQADVPLTNFPDLNVQRRHQRDASIVSVFSGIIGCGPGSVLLNS